MIKDILNKYRFDLNSDRIGPDCPFLHYKLYFKTSMIKLCKRKFKHFGEKAEFRPGAYAIACSKISLGRNVIIRPCTMLFAFPHGVEGEIKIEDDVMIGSGVHFYTANHRFDTLEKPFIQQGHYPAESILVKKGAWIGANSVILPGVTIGANTVVGAGSVVTKSIPSGSVAVGNPAKVIKKIRGSDDFITR